MIHLTPTRKETFMQMNDAMETRLYLVNRALDAGLQPAEALGQARALWDFVQGPYGSDGAIEAVEYRGTIGAEGDVVGIALHKNGAWRRVDAAGRTLHHERTYFDTHPVWAGIRDVPTNVDVVTVEIPRFWVRSERRGDERLWLVSPCARPGYRLHPAFLRPDGTACAALRVGKYPASEREGRIVGEAGNKPWTGVTIGDAREHCAALGQGWRLYSIYDLAAIQLLMLIEIGGTDMQGALGRGNVDGGGVKPTGETSAVWRGIHDLWGNVWQFVDGLQLAEDGEIVLWSADVPGGDDWVATGVHYGPGEKDGYPVDFHDERGSGFDLSPLFLPSEVVADKEAAVIPDRAWGHWSGRVTIALSGGHWLHGVNAGVFALSLNNPRSVALSIIGFRPAFAF